VVTVKFGLSASWLFTTTEKTPEIAPGGTVATIDVALQLTTLAVVPFSVTALAPCVAPRLIPVRVTDVPTTPEFGDRLVMLGVVITENADPLLAAPLTVTTTLPVVAPAGTVATIDVALQLVMAVAAVPLNRTVPIACMEPKLVPVIVTEAPGAPEVGDRPVMLGAGTTVNGDPALATPFTVTTTLPVIAPAGTVATIDVALQLMIAVAVVPLNVTVLVPCVAPKLVPAIATDAPVAPEVGQKLVMPGVSKTVNDDPALAAPLAVTTTLPVVAPAGTVITIDVALQLVMVVAAVPLNVTALDPCAEPKLVPVIVTGAPTAPEVGDKLVMLGVGRTVNDDPALATPLAVTSTFPVVAPAGTVATIDVALQLVMIVAAVPLNVTVLVP